MVINKNIMKKNRIRFFVLFSALLLLVFHATAQEEKSLPDMLKGNVEPYYFSTILMGSYDDVDAKVRAALKSEGFGVISEIDVDKALREKLEVDMPRYVILGACSPRHAYEALQAEDKVGTMLPCNVVIQQLDENKFEVAAVNPVASMMAIDNDELVKVALEVTDSLRKVIANLK
jgi:uncharacterized protein (DUF302 family)